MFLYERADFRDILDFTSKKMGVDVDIIERDYWYSYCAYMLTRFDERITIKGSYVLSKIYNQYYRMPNDLDFSLEVANDDLIGKRICIKNAISSIGTPVILDQEATSNLHGVFSFPAIYCADNKIRIESLVYSPLGRKREKMRVNTFVYMYHGDDGLIVHPELSFVINVYDKRLMAIDKIFCIFYFTSSEFRGDQSRLYCALYDVSCMLSSIDFTDKHFINLVATKISEKYKGRYAYKAYSEFFNVTPENWKVNLYNKGYTEYLKANSLKPTKTFSQTMGTLGQFRNLLLSNDVFSFLIHLVNEINGID